MSRGDGFGTSSEHWGTPQALFDRLNVMFNFELDPCAANGEIAKCPLFYTPEDDGLKLPWRGRVFLNPPYGRNRVKKWVAKAASELVIENAELVVALLPASVGTHWFNDYVMPYATQIFFVRGRVAFEDYTGVSDKAAQANFDSVIVVMKPKKEFPTTVSTWGRRQ